MVFQMIRRVTDSFSTNNPKPSRFKYELCYAYINLRLPSYSSRLLLYISSRASLSSTEPCLRVVVNSNLIQGGLDSVDQASRLHLFFPCIITCKYLFLILPNRRWKYALDYNNYHCILTYTNSVGTLKFETMFNLSRN